MAQPTQERLVNQLERPEQTGGNVGQAGSGTQSENAPHHEDHSDNHVEHVSMNTYYLIFAALMFLLLITVGAWYFDQHIRPLGHFSPVLAMAIAVAKAVLIVLFFMHVKFASKLVQIFACTGIAFVAIMFLLTFNDFVTRDWLPVPGVYAPATVTAGPAENTIYRPSSVGAAPNSVSTPSDNMVGSAMTAPGNATQTAIDGGRDAGGRTTTPGASGSDVRVIPNTNGATTTGPTNMTTGAMQNGGTSSASAGAPGGASVSTGDKQAGALGASGIDSGPQQVASNGSASRPGPHIGGAANNVYGSAAQSKGIQPQSAAPAPAIPQSAQVLNNGQ